MHRSNFAKAKPSYPRYQSIERQPKSIPEEPAFYISKVTIQLGSGNSREISPKKLSSSQTRLSPQPKVSHNSYPTPEKTNSKESLSTSVVNQGSKKPVEGTPRTSTPTFNSYTTPEKTANSKESLSTSVLNQGSKKPVEGTLRTSTPEPRKSMSPPVGQQPIRGFDRQRILTKVESHTDRRKPFYDSTATNGIDSIQEEKTNIPPLEFPTTQSHRDEFSLKKHWYYDILQRIEDLSWSYQNLEVEYSFLEKLMAEQKEDLKKAKNWSKRLHNQNAPNRTKKVH